MSIFPIINTIDDVLPFIEGSDDFVIADKGTYTVINYIKISSDTFRPLTGEEMTDEEYRKRMVRRECRGLIFDNVTNKIISRPFHKFHNVNENVDSLLENIDFTEPYNVLEKLDGSMIRFFKTSDDVWWVGTKMGQTDIALQVNDFIATWDDADIDDFYNWLVDYIHYDYTPIFEWCSRKNRVVIDHPKDRLVLTAIRSNYDGHYLHFDEELLEEIPNRIELVKVIANDHPTPADLLEAARNLVDEEGYVIRFDSGRMYKMKGDTYVAIHKAKDQILYERYVVQLILEDKMDDVLPYLSEDDKKEVENYRDNLQWFIAQVSHTFGTKFFWLAVKDITRKDFALQHKDEFGILSSIIFHDFDLIAEKNMNMQEWLSFFELRVVYMFMKYTNSNSKFKEFKQAINFKSKWKETVIE